MKITRATDYAIMGLVYLAAQPKDAVVSLRKIAEDLDISRDFLVRIFDKLPFITAYRGPKGGVTLTKAPEEISFMDIIRILEGDNALSLDATLLDKFSKINPKLQENWNRLQHKMANRMAEVTLQSCAVNSSPFRKNIPADTNT